MDLFSTLQLLHEAVMSVLVTTIYGRWRGTITVIIQTLYRTNFLKLTSIPLELDNTVLMLCIYCTLNH